MSRRVVLLGACVALVALPLFGIVSVSAQPPSGGDTTTTPTSDASASSASASGESTTVTPSTGDGATTSGPVLTLDRTTVSPGDFIHVIVDGFTGTAVTISVCGNEARRGSPDCNMSASEGLRLDRDGSSTLIQIPVAAPPVDCPCVIRVATRNNDEVVTSPINLLGHPVGPVVDPVVMANPLTVAIDARYAPAGVVGTVRAGLGGPAPYAVTVSVTNHSTVTLHRVALAASVGRNDHDHLATLEFDDPGELAPGQTWRQTLPARVPAPSFGDLRWRVAASGMGQAVEATDITHHRPTMLIVVLSLLLLDIGFLLIRWRVRHWANKAAMTPAAAAAESAA